MPASSTVPLRPEAANGLWGCTWITFMAVVRRRASETLPRAWVMKSTSSGDINEIGKPYDHRNGCERNLTLASRVSVQLGALKLTDTHSSGFRRPRQRVDGLRTGPWSLGHLQRLSCTSHHTPQRLHRDPARNILVPRDSPPSPDW